MMSATKGKDVQTRPSDQEIINKFNGMKQELQQIATKIGELEAEKDEHQLVIDTITPLSADRACFRLVGGVLVKLTVKDTLPLVDQNKQGILALMQQLGATYKKKEEEMTAFQTQYNIKVKA